MMLADGSLHRPKLASIIFSDPEKKKLLESILHPLIRKSWLERLEELKKTGAPLIVYVVPLFFESTSDMPEIQQVVLISAPEETRIERIMSRDQFPRDLAELRIRAQLPDSAKEAKSDFVIKNDSTLDELIEKASQVFSSLALGF
jgi:dephospho-CoA kinase